jgi:hypothetical protein
MNEEQKILEHAESQLSSVLGKIPAVSPPQIRKEIYFLGICRQNISISSST